VQVITSSDEYVLNNCTKFLARDLGEARHNDGQYPEGDFRSFVAESWRFPIIDSWADGTSFVPDYSLNSVTFVYPILGGATNPKSVSVIGSFATLFEPIPLRQVSATPFFTTTVLLPKGQVHTYKYMVEGQPQLDPVNPQRSVLDNGKTWSRFFTQLCTQPITFENWELDLLERITERILPFHTEAGRNFLSRFYDGLNKQDRASQYAWAYRLDQPPWSCQLHRQAPSQGGERPPDRLPDLPESD
jgi:hypothetical protein